MNPDLASLQLARIVCPECAGQGDKGASVCLLCMGEGAVEA